MPALAKVRYDKFCFAVAGGKLESEAYIEAGYSSKGAAQGARNLLNRPEVAARVAELRAEFASRMTDIKYANKRNRVELLDNLAGRLVEVLEARAADPMTARQPGGKTGTQVVTLSTIMDADGKRKVVPEVATDTATLAEIRALLLHVGREMGDIDPDNKTAVTVNVVTTRFDEGEGDD